MEKRGFAMSFYWIFAIIAGIIIFLFLINFAYKHIYISEKATSSVILSDLENQLESLSIAEDLDTMMDLNKDFTVIFDCNSLSLDKLKINTEKIIFSNKVISSKELLIWTRAWKYPFAVANFYYIIPKNLKFYFFDAPYDLLSGIPASFQVYSYPDDVPDKAVLIFFRQPSQQELVQYKNHVIKIVQDSQIIFYPVKTANYYGNEMLLGAVFTDDYNKFECLKEKALKRLNITSLVYQKKAETLSMIECPDQYQTMISSLNDFKNNPVNPEIIDNQDKELEKNACTPLFH